MAVPESDVVPKKPSNEFSIPLPEDVAELATLRPNLEVRTSPKWTEFPEYPVIASTATLAIAVTIAWWSKVNISPLVATAMIRRGELWRLMTSIFPHGDILHLTFNVYWLWIFGTVIERVYGHLRTAALIALFALGSSSLEFAFDLGGVGLSGVGYGLFGLLWVLSRHDERFRGAITPKIIRLFIGWFFFCIALTVMHIFPVGNIAHGAGAVLGILTATAIVMPQRRTPIAVGIGAVLLFGLWGSTLGRPRINFSRSAGYEEETWGYDALEANRDQEAVRWLRDAVVYQQKIAAYWFNLGIAYQRLGNKAAASAAYQRAHELEPDNKEYLDTAVDAAGDSID